VFLGCAITRPKSKKNGLYGRSQEKLLGDNATPLPTILYNTPTHTIHLYMDGILFYNLIIFF